MMPTVSKHALNAKTQLEYTRMWAKAQRDGRPPEYRWRPLLHRATITTAQQLLRWATVWPQQTSAEKREGAAVGALGPHWVTI